MRNEKKSRWLVWLMGILLLVVAGKTVSWFTWEREMWQTRKPEKTVAAKVKKTVPGIREGEFTLKVNRYLNDKITVRYLIPVDKNGRPKPSASNVVCYAPYNGDAAEIQRGLKPWHWYFTEKLGFTIFSLAIKTDTKVTHDRKKYYIFPEAGWYEIFFGIQERIEKENHLEHRPLLMVGESSGGSMAQMMSASYPDRVAAAAWCGGSKYDPVGKGNRSAWLALNTWGCYGIPNTRIFQRQAETQGQQVLRAETATNGEDHHSAGEMSYHLMHIFIRDMVNLRDRNGGKIPPVEEWPVCREQNGKKRYFPSAEFAACWDRVPHEVNRQLENDAGPVMAVFPYEGPVDRIVIYADEGNDNFSVLPQDVLYDLSHKKVLPISFKVGDNYRQDFEQMKQALTDVLKNPEWRELPVYVVGRGIGGQILAAAALANGNKRIAGIVTFNSEYENPFDHMSIAAHRNDSVLPLRMYFDKTAMSPGMKPIPHTEVISVDEEDNNKKWLARLNAVIR
ncbi:MAG: hypothetical protein PHQ27_02880 [Victivallales bacterium]|nr:hypothetical protein [Victivallales bacterium]